MKFRRWAPSVVVFSFATCLFAGPLFELPPDKSPKSAMAREALGKFQAAEKDATSAFTAAMKSANDEVLKDLEAARADAAKRKDTEEAARIQAVLGDFKARTGDTADAAKALRTALAAPGGVLFKRFGKSSNITLKPDGTVIDGGRKTEIKWDVAGDEGGVVITFTEPNRACRFVHYEGNTYVGVYPDGSPAAISYK